MTPWNAAKNSACEFDKILPTGHGTIPDVVSTTFPNSITVYAQVPPSVDGFLPMVPPSTNTALSM